MAVAFSTDLNEEVWVPCCWWWQCIGNPCPILPPSTCHRHGQRAKDQSLGKCYIGGDYDLLRLCANKSSALIREVGRGGGKLQQKKKTGKWTDKKSPWPAACRHCCQHCLFSVPCWTTKLKSMLPIACHGLNRTVVSAVFSRDFIQQEWAIQRQRNNRNIPQNSWKVRLEEITGFVAFNYF